MNIFYALECRYENITTYFGKYNFFILFYSMSNKILLIINMRSKYNLNISCMKILYQIHPHPPSKHIHTKKKNEKYIIRPQGHSPVGPT